MYAVGVQKYQDAEFIIRTLLERCTKVYFIVYKDIQGSEMLK